MALDDLTYIREYRPAGNGGAAICVVRANTYSSRLVFLDRLMAIALKEFPGLDRGSVEVKCYGGVSYKGTFGIEFRAPRDPGEGWREISQLECTL